MLPKPPQQTKQWDPKTRTPAARNFGNSLPLKEDLIRWGSFINKLLISAGELTNYSLRSKQRLIEMNQANYSEINQSLPKSYIFNNALISLALLEIAPWQTSQQDQFGGGCGPTRSRRNWRWTGGGRWYPSLKRVVHLNRSQETQKEMNHLPQIVQRIVLGRVVVKFSQKNG